MLESSEAALPVSSSEFHRVSNVKRSTGYYIRRVCDYTTTFGFWNMIRLFGARLIPTGVCTVRVKGIKTTVKCRTPGSDQKVLGSIFVDRDCDIPMNTAPHLIIDGGANVGYSSVFFAEKYPDALILAIEPDPANLEIARENCSAYPNIRIIEGGIWPRDSYLAIANPEADSWEFRVNEVDASTTGAMKAYSIRTLLKMSGLDKIDLLKLDIEGAEQPLFGYADTEWLNQVDLIVVEIHGENAFQTVQKALQGYPFVLSQKFEKCVFTKQT